MAEYIGTYMFHSMLSAIRSLGKNSRRPPALYCPVSPVVYSMCSRNSFVRERIENKVQALLGARLQRHGQPVACICTLYSRV